MLQRMAGAPQPTVFQAPDSLSYNTSDSTSITMQWTNHGSHPVEIYRGGTLIHTTSAGATSYTDTGLSVATVYNYMIRYKNGTSYSAMTVNVVMATSLPTPGTLTYVVFVRDVTLNWTNTTLLAAVVVKRGVSVIATLAAGTATYVDAGLADATYAYTIHYSLSGNTSADSNEVDPVVAATVNQPTSPSATAHSGSGTQIDLAWTLGTVGAQTEIYRGTSANPTTLVHTTSAGDTTYSDTGLTPNTTYHYRLKGLHDTIESASYTSDFSAATHNPPSGPPTGLGKTIPNTDRVSLSWTDADSGATINIYRDGSLLTNVVATTTSYNDDTVVAGTTYSYQVSHLKDSIESSLTSAVTAAVPVNAFASQSVVGNIGDSALTVSWTILHGPRSATVNLDATTNSDGGAISGATGVTSPLSVDLAFTIVGKNPGVNHEITVGLTLRMKNGGGTTVATDTSFAWGGYAPN